ncbi:MAG: hypothetical protein Q9173_001441 [Seirophora scorigena]
MDEASLGGVSRCFPDASVSRHGWGPDGWRDVLLLPSSGLDKISDCLVSLIGRLSSLILLTPPRCPFLLALLNTLASLLPPFAFPSHPDPSLFSGRNRARGTSVDLHLLHDGSLRFWKHWLCADNIRKGNLLVVPSLRVSDETSFTITRRPQIPYHSPPDRADSLISHSKLPWNKANLARPFATKKEPHLDLQTCLSLPVADQPWSLPCPFIDEFLHWALEINLA